MSSAGHGNEQAAKPPVSLATYQALVDRCARDRLNYPIANGSAMHARILIDKLFEIATHEVCLVTGSLRQASNDGVEIYAYEKVINAARRFLRSSPDTSLTVVVQRGGLDGDARNIFLREVVNDNERQGTVRVLIPNVGVLSDNETPHFMLTDRGAYRFETGRDANPQNESISAVANFGDPQSARVLATIFETAVALINTDNNLRSGRVYSRNEHIPA